MRLKYKFETIKLDDQVVAVPVGEDAQELHSIVKLNETAAFIFDLLKEEITEDAIVEALASEYDASKVVLAADAHSYLEDFKIKGLLVE